MSNDPLLEERENGAYYLGDLEAGLRLAERDRYIFVVQRPDGSFQVTLCDDPEGNEVAEWGAGATQHEATRYALGAAFGPIDSEYDEECLRACLRAHLFPMPADAGVAELDRWLRS